MAITYIQAFPPLWYIVGNDGLAAGGAQMFTYDSLTRQPKAIYQDPGATLAWIQPVIFKLNGTSGPFYWKVDSSDPTDSYYVEVFDIDGNLLWQADHFPASGSGGGGNVTTYIPVINYITNNQFINHIDAQAGPLPTNLVISSSNHKGFTPALINPVVGTYGVLGPDIRFVKNNTNAVDQLSFPLFALSNAPLTSDVTPVDYIRYQCSNMPNSETYKSFQFPITQKVKNLSNQSMTFTLWAAVTSTPVNIQAYSRQYYGSGTGATPESDSTRVAIGVPMALTSTWQQFTRSFTMPSVSGNSIGTPGLQTDDDAIYIQIDMPLGVVCDVLFTKPALYLGDISPNLTFDSYDQIDSINQTPRCGDIRVGYSASAPFGWLPMNDGTIGNVGSMASLAIGAYTFQLYKTLWDAVSNAYAPIAPNTDRGSSAIADFLARQTIKLPRSLGRVLAANGTGAGLTATLLGQFSGTEASSVTLLDTNLPPHSHLIGAYQVGGLTVATGASSNIQFVAGSSFTGNGPGTSAPFSVPIIQPSSYMNVYIKL